MLELKMLQNESFPEFVVRVMTNLEEFGLNKQQAFKGLFNKDMAVDNIRKVSYMTTYISEAIDSGYADKFKAEGAKVEELPTYKSTTEILSDGTHKSDKLLQMSSEQSKDSNYLLKAHGFEPTNWELLNVKNNIWNSYSKVDGIMTLYSSKLTAKPKVHDFDLNWFKEVFDSIEPIDPFDLSCVEQTTPTSNKTVEIQLADLHIGLNGIEYEEQLNNIIDSMIDKYKYVEHFIIPIGQDWLNSDIQIGADFKTTKGTSLEQSLSYKEMYQTGIRVASRLLDNILSKTSATVECIYIPANHDRHSAFGLFCALMQRYYHYTHNAMITKRISFDDSTKPRKYRKIGVVGLGMGHGDNEGKRIYEAFSVEAPTIMANTKYREFHLSHLHHESVKDVGGIIYRRLPTPNTPDNWHTELGFIGSTNRVQAFVYDSENGLDSIDYYYV